MPNKIYLVPRSLCDENTAIGSDFLRPIHDVRIFFVEEERSARRFLKKIDPDFPLEACAFFLLNEHTPAAQAQRCLEEVTEKDVGIISEAGCPCVADPGADVVLFAHKKGWQVVPLVGPSSIVLALMASGLNGQNFAFNGYLPKDHKSRVQKLKELEKRSGAEGQAQIFMETPYRNQHLFDDIVKNCEPGTWLCVAVDLTLSSEWIKTRTVQEWRAACCVLPKRPALFLIEKRRS